MGVSVTRRSRDVEQPRGGFLNPKDMVVTQLPCAKELENENVSPALIGLAVDYLTRYMTTRNAESAFQISLLGAEKGGYISQARNYLSRVRGLDKESVIATLRLSGYDDIYRAGIKSYKPVEGINPDDATVRNIIEMVNRSLNFWQIYGPVTLDGFTFEEDGYTDVVSAGDGDYLTTDTLWEFKVSKEAIPRICYTLQLLMYWIMGVHSGKKEFYDIKNVGIYNPRLNWVYTYELSKLDPCVIADIEKNVICYK